MSCDSVSLPCSSVCALESCTAAVSSEDNYRKDTVCDTDRVWQRRFFFFFPLLVFIFQQRKQYIENKAGSRSTNIMLAQL